MTDEPRFKVGDKVAVYNPSCWGLTPQRWDEVAKVTPTGRTRLKGAPKDIFDQRGWQRTSGYSRDHIKHDTPELRQEIAAEQEEKELRRLPNSYPWRNLTLPQLRCLKVLLDEFKAESL